MSLLRTTSNRQFIGGLMVLPVLVALAAVPTRAGFKDVVAIPSATMKRSFKATIVFPTSYKTEKERRYTVLYLLHGFSQNHTVWARIAPLEAYADRYQMIFVCPDGDYDSWYLNSPLKKRSHFETYIAHEVPDFVDQSYRTVAARRGRALIGSSMGGHGALTIVAKHPDRFRGAGSISGITDLTQFPDKWGLSKALGPYSKNREIWKQFSFVGIYHKLAQTNTGLVLDCGTADFALEGNRHAHKLLLKAGIPHQYFERPGSHTPDYVAAALEYHLLYFHRILEEGRD
ncbi:MAG: prolyl oligopeptidase family serine peptidase [Chitinivibrionales bacterium]|nr:prolyl oligopeptidase family serine peptidase [Chitinivibrionales bacterium]MBD3358831.1 prolyl oligopeptidase family serine peptidase [Chitinivibrionales bacterium]